MVPSRYCLWSAFRVCVSGYDTEHPWDFSRTLAELCSGTRRHKTAPKMELVLPPRLSAVWSWTLLCHLSACMLWFLLLTAMKKILHQYHYNVLRHQCLQLCALLPCQTFITQKHQWQTQTSTCISPTLVQNLVYYLPSEKWEHSSVNWMNSWATGTHE